MKKIISWFIFLSLIIQYNCLSQSSYIRGFCGYTLPIRKYIDSNGGILYGGSINYMYYKNIGIGINISYSKWKMQEFDEVQYRSIVPLTVNLLYCLNESEIAKIKFISIIGGGAYFNKFTQKRDWTHITHIEHIKIYPGLCTGFNISAHLSKYVGLYTE